MCFVMMTLTDKTDHDNAIRALFSVNCLVSIGSTGWVKANELFPINIVCQVTGLGRHCRRKLRSLTKKTLIELVLWATSYWFTIVPSMNVFLYGYRWKVRSTSTFFSFYAFYIISLTFFFINNAITSYFLNVPKASLLSSVTDERFSWLLSVKPPWRAKEIICESNCV